MLTSATLAVGGSFEPVAGRLGLDRSPRPWRGLDVGSPFDYGEQALLYCAAQLPDPRAAGYEAAALAELEGLVRAAGGRALCLFTSRRAMTAAADHLRGRLPYQLLVQDELPRPQLQARFLDDETSVLLATMGFWQGFDAPGRTCSLVVIDRLPFSRPDDPLAEARRAAATKARQNAFHAVDLPAAAVLLAQGAGRLVRHRNDRGVVAVLDRRLATASYRWTLVRSLPPMRRTKDPAEARRFLAELTAPAGAELTEPAGAELTAPAGARLTGTRRGPAHVAVRGPAHRADRGQSHRSPEHERPRSRPWRPKSRCLRILAGHGGGQEGARPHVGYRPGRAGRRRARWSASCAGPAPTSACPAWTTLGRHTVLEPANAWFRCLGDRRSRRDGRSPWLGSPVPPRTACSPISPPTATQRAREGSERRRSGSPAGHRRARPEDRSRDQAEVPYTASVTWAGLGTWDYPGTVTVVRPARKANDGDVADGLEAVEPATRASPTPAISTSRSRGPPGRESSLLADWQPGRSRQGLRPPSSGALGPATQAQADSLGPPYRAGQSIGVSGLQASQERLLAGTPTADVRLLEGTVVVGVPYHHDGTTPSPATVTIDPNLQALAQRALDGAPPGKLAAMVAIRPSTGDILVSASRPAGGYDRAFLGLYPPGSTFKTITTIALLTKGMGLDETISCPAQVAIGGRTFVNAEGHVLGNIPFRRAFAESCNTAFVQLAQRLTPQELRATADALGFNRDPALGVPAATSSVPVPEGPVDLAASSIGQGRILVTPLQMATVAASVAAGGYRPPRLVANGQPVPVTPLAPGVAAATTELMRLVVTDGTGTAARLAGTPVAGKTGTAEFGTAVPPHTHAWFIAFRGDLAVAVLVDDGGFGGDVAAPIAANFFRAVGG